MSLVPSRRLLFWKGAFNLMYLFWDFSVQLVSKLGALSWKWCHIQDESENCVFKVAVVFTFPVKAIEVDHIFLSILCLETPKGLGHKEIFYNTVRTAKRGFILAIITTFCIHNRGGGGGFLFFQLGTCEIQRPGTKASHQKNESVSGKVNHHVQNICKGTSSPLVGIVEDL